VFPFARRASGGGHRGAITLRKPDGQPIKAATNKMKNAVEKIRSVGVTKINQLVRAAAHLKELQPAFADWAAGEIYVCKKTASYRYRFGDRGKSPTAWSPLVEKLFTSPEAFAFAALVLGSDKAEITREIDPVIPSERANVISMATRKALAA
jgi:hypothetical protein